MNKLFSHPMKLFYLICPIGFESLLLKELEYKWSLCFPSEDFRITSQDKGGIEIECLLQYGLSLNYILKIPSRILMRIKKQKCRDLPKLFNIIKKINWKEYLKQTNIEFCISSRKSRIIHTKRIEETTLSAVEFYFNAHKIPQKLLLKDAPPQSIHLRLFKDELDISLDTSGELLHKRSTHSFRGNASIRENYAAALLLYLLDFSSFDKLSLIDPMCGSGTFLKEALHFFSFNDRDFSFKNWNIPISVPLCKLENIWNFKIYKGYDLDENTATKAACSGMQVECADFYQLRPAAESLLILNPPYGKRIAIHGDKQKYFDSLIEHIKNKIQPKRFGIIIPRGFSKKYHPTRKLAFNQNGIKVEFLYFANKAQEEGMKSF